MPLLRSATRNWEIWGETEPYFGVLADPRFRSDRIAENKALFFQTGEETVEALIRRFEAHFGAVARGRALDHGCGVGRLTLPLARRFSEVVALDIAPAMIAEGQANAEAAGLGNITFGAASDDLAAATGGFDFVNSFIVLQHIPVRRGLRILTELGRRVSPGGGLHVHVSVRTDRRRHRLLWWASHHVPGVKVIQNVRAGRRWDAPSMQMNNYPLGPIVANLAELGITDLLISSERHGRFLTLSIMGRKPASGPA